MNHLDAFSHRFADILFDAFPAWRAYARYDDTEGVPAGTIYLIIPHPDDTKRLYIWTEDEEVTVGWCGWHTHFGRWLGISDEEAYQQAMSMIHDILSETVVVVMYFDHDGNVRGGWVCPVTEAYAYQKEHPGVRVCIRSWRGFYDRRLES